MEEQRLKETAVKESIYQDVYDNLKIIMDNPRGGSFEESYRRIHNICYGAQAVNRLALPDRLAKLHTTLTLFCNDNGDSIRAMRPHRRERFSKCINDVFMSFNRASLHHGTEGSKNILKAQFPEMAAAGTAADGDDHGYATP